jgi:UDPglucose 6-dehydrogenase
LGPFLLPKNPPDRAATDADALVLLTEWKQFAHLDLHDIAQRMAHPILVDGRNLYDPEAARQAGFDYCGIGRPQRAGGAIKSLNDLAGGLKPATAR